MIIENELERGRFVTHLPGGDGVLNYSMRSPGIMDLRHTEVPPVERNRGVGAALVEHAVLHARDQGLRIIPSCPFVLRWFSLHPEHADLVESGV